MVDEKVEEFKVVGKSLRRKEAVDKLVGKARYTDDIPFEEILYGRTIRSTVPRGLVKKVEFLDGVPWDEFTVVRASDIPGRNGVLLFDDSQPLLNEGEIKHIAEPILLIAHKDKYLVEKAATLVRIEYEELPAMFTIEESRRGDNIQYGDDNVFNEYRVENSPPDEVWENCDLVLEETYRTAAQEHLYIEPNVVVAHRQSEKALTITGSIQCPYYIQKALAPIFNLEPKSIRVIQAETGGAFGGKEEYPNMIAGHAALLSLKAGGRPVKILYDREEDMWATTKRHPSLTTVKAGFRKDGKLLALDIDFNLNAGAYTTLSRTVLSRGILHSWGPYRCDHTRVRARSWMTNSNPYGAFRGFGAPQSIFAIETHMNHAAWSLGMDPAEIRRINFLHKGDRMPTGQEIKEEIDLEMMLERAMEVSRYRSRRKKYEDLNKLGGSRRYGNSISFFYHGSGFTGSGEAMMGSEAAVEVGEDGSVDVLSSNVEYGQGTNTCFTQIAAETLRIDPARVKVHQPDTSEVPNSGPTVASRTTMVVGKLIQQACLKLLDRVRSEQGLPEDYTEEQLIEGAMALREREGGLRETVRYEPPEDVYWDDQNYRGSAYAAYAWSCDVADVVLDTVDYSVKVTDFVSIVECGKVINPHIAAGQIEGGIAQAIGFAIMEKAVMERGEMLNRQFTNYIIPTAADTPDIKVEFTEFPHMNYGPYAAKGIGEMPIDGPMAAIVSAAAIALNGNFINEIPLLPEVVMAAVEKLPREPLEV